MQWDHLLEGKQNVYYHMFQNQLHPTLDLLYLNVYIYTYEQLERWGDFCF